jgi:hypothetical protein
VPCKSRVSPKGAHRTYPLGLAWGHPLDGLNRRRDEQGRKPASLDALIKPVE